MRYTTAFLIKFIMITAVLWIVFGMFFGVGFGEILLTSLIFTAFAFAVDVFFLPTLGNVPAAIGDFVLALLGIWILGGYFFDVTVNLLTASFISALAITVGELLFHRYMRNNVFYNVDSGAEVTHTTNLQTEASEELEPNTKNKKR